MLSLDCWTTDRGVIDTQLKCQIDNKSDHKNISTKLWKAAHQTENRQRAPNKANNITIFDNFNARRNHVEIDGTRYLRDSVSVDYITINFLDQYRNLKLFYEEYNKEPLLNPFII